MVDITGKKPLEFGAQTKADLISALGIDQKLNSADVVDASTLFYTKDQINAIVESLFTGITIGDYIYTVHKDTTFANTLLNGLVSKWKFEETSGDAIDEIGITNLVNHGATQNQTGKIGKCYLFNGTSSYVGGVDTTFELTAGLSISALVNFTGDGVVRQIASNAMYGTVKGFTLNISDWGNRPQFTVGDGTSTPANVDVTGDPLNINTWYHIVGTFNGTTARLYVNGTEVGIAQTWAHPIAYDAAERFCIGARAESNQYMSGLIDEVYIWNRGLTPEEVLLIPSE